jgi:hypothetical protein
MQFSENHLSISASFCGVKHPFAFSGATDSCGTGNKKDNI